jgi:hypothetical protein
MGGIPIFGELAALFARLEFTGFLYLMRFAGKSPGYASLKSGSFVSIIAKEWDRLVVVYVCKT